MSKQLIKTPRKLAKAPKSIVRKYWWTADCYTLQPDPVFHPATGDLIAWAVTVRTADFAPPVGIVAVFRKPATATIGMALWAAQAFIHSPEVMDAWNTRPNIIPNHVDARGNPPFVPLPFSPTGNVPPLPEDATLDLNAYCRQIAELVWAHRPLDDPLSILFEAATRSTRYDGPASVIAAMHAIAAFFQLPAGEQREILNGWRFDPEFQTTRELKEMSEWAAYLILTLHSDGESPDKSDARVTWDLTDVFELRPVKVTVFAGTAKTEAVKALRAIVNRLEHEWDALVGGEPERP